MGVVPSVVYLIVAPIVPVTRVIVTDPVYVPDIGVMVGARTLIANKDVVVSLSAIPPLEAYAIIVVLVACVKGPTYRVEDAFGVVPSVVYLIDAPAVPVEIVITTEPV